MPRFTNDNRVSREVSIGLILAFISQDDKYTIRRINEIVGVLSHSDLLEVLSMLEEIEQRCETKSATCSILIQELKRLSEAGVIAEN